jgi:ketosteroid isomerase-like protein
MRLSIAGLAVLLTALALSPASADAPPDLRGQVIAAETAFAQTMAARDFKAFGGFVAEDAIFFGGRGAHRGRAAVLEAWKALFDGPKAPFSWRPEVVEVLDSGTLAHSSGPVFDPGGKLTGTFNSVWRLDPDHHWRVVFDKGCAVCDTTRAR